MTREEAIERIKMILEEATANEDAVSYVTSDDADALEMAIKALEQEPFMNKACVSSKVCEHDKEVALNEIRAEIEQHIDKEKLSFGGQFDGGLNLALKIIDKYRTESEK